MKRRLLFALSALLLASCGELVVRGAHVPAQEIRITAYQWGFQPEVVRLRRGQSYRIVLESVDVMHGFASSELGFRRTIPAKGQGEDSFLMTPHKEGEFVARCTMPCGPGHRRMALTIVVYP